MRLSACFASAMLAYTVTACGDAATACCTTGQPAVRVVNAFTGPVDVLIDGQVAIASLAAGAIDTAVTISGGHAIAIRQTGSPTLVSLSIDVGPMSTLAVVRSTAGGVSSAVLDDTNSVVPAGATKVRVLHLAPNAGEIEVFRTQPDYQTPVSWQFPFTYQSEFNSLSAPFYQSTVGTWDVRAWQKSVGPSGWDNAPVKTLIPLASGEKRTVIILDKPGGGIRYESL